MNVSRPSVYFEEIPVEGRAPIQLADFEPSLDHFRDDVLNGLRQRVKALPSKYFYDERGSKLFEKITELPMYYPTRTELAILTRSGHEIAERLGPNCLLVEYGSGISTKARIVLKHLAEPAGYLSVDISRESLLEAALEVAETYPALPVYAVCADYMNTFTLPEVGGERTVVFFPGSTIGNLTPAVAESFLHRIAERIGMDGRLLIGVDLKKDRETLEAAYNDPQGITAAFNKNLLTRINRELDGDFDLELFDHRATYNQAHGRVEMHLVSRIRQDVQVGGERIPFQDGETIHTENSYKYDLEGFSERADAAGLSVEHVWTDERRLFSVQLLQVKQ